MTRQALAAVAMVMSAVALGATQESTPTSRVTTAVVQVPVSVRDGTPEDMDDVLRAVVKVQRGASMEGG